MDVAASTETQGRLGHRAIVVGGSIVGLLAALVLRQHFAEVLVLEKDAPEDGTQPLQPRKGVPQGHHLHILLSGGANALMELLPGLDRDLEQLGGLNGDFSRDIRWFYNGRWFPRFESGLSLFLQTRPLLESAVRRRVAAMDGVRLLYGQRATRYRLSDFGAVDGVELVEPWHGQTVLGADFVVDASGRGALYPKWLENAGFGAPPETLIGFDLSYSTTFFARTPDASRDWLLTACHPLPPNDMRGGVLCAVEGDRWHVTLAGYHGDHPPTDEDGFKAWAPGLPIPHIYEAIKFATPVAPIRCYHFPASLLRRYERMRRLPQRIVAIGDAICSLNPAFGQGISGGALQVAELRTQLSAAADRGTLDGLPQRFFKNAAKIAWEPWDLSAGENLKYPATTGRRPLLFPVMSWYRDRILASADPVVTDQFFRVMHLMDPGASFLSPHMLTRVLASRRISDTPAVAPALPEPQTVT